MIKAAREIVLATANPHKVEEMRAIFAAAGVPVIGLADLPGGAAIPEPSETGRTFEANARLKALAYAKATGRVCLADDSGLEVDALGGAPGVDSAHYAHGFGTSAPRAERDAANNAKLLAMLEGVPPERRGARFVCVMVAAAPDGAVLAEARGEFSGRIGEAPRGSNGFGYDPLLILPDGRTSAELEPGEKNARSHRAAAARAIAPALAGLIPGLER